jgi:hypothetical protein
MALSNVQNWAVGQNQALADANAKEVRSRDAYICVENSNNAVFNAAHPIGAVLGHGQ